MFHALPNWHPMSVHFTVALLTVAVLLFIVSRVTRGAVSRTVEQAARVNLLGGALFTIGTVLTGWYAYNSVPHDGASHAVMTTHRNWALITAASFAVLAIWCVRNWINNQREGPAFVLLAAVATTPLVVTGHYGGELVYGHGVGVQSLPDTNGHAHSDDDHGHDSGREDDRPEHDDDHHDHADDDDHEH